MALAAFAFERGESLYLVTPVTPIEPEEREIEEFAFADVLRHAPNPHIVWMRGQYVEGDRPNLNGAMWLSDELAVKSLTPNFMPVTVMHDPRTAVGLIADTRLVLPDEAAGDGAPKRARLDNTIGLWGHRFPEAVEEALANYEQGSLMQSMECKKPFYDCAECGMRFASLPGGAEEANWCDHLKGVQGEQAARILGGVCFTGTGLIFGSRGAKGAYDEATLEPLMEEVAEFHERAHQTDSRKTRTTPTKPRSKRTMEIDDKRYEELVAAESRVKALEEENSTLKVEADKVPQLEKDLESTETAKVAAETKVTELTTEKEALEESARADTLKTERWDKLGKDFLAKLGDKTKAKLEEQAKLPNVTVAFPGEHWSNRYASENIVPGDAVSRRSSTAVWHAQGRRG
jgi:hypothetical protein